MKLLKQLQDANQDFEWYPTTNEIIDALYFDILEHYGDFYHGCSISMLDIGAGDCKVARRIEEIAKRLETGKENESTQQDKRVRISKLLVIEKSQILIDQMPRKAIVVGVDFHENTLIDKPVDIVFSNPPYSQYVQWTAKIIQEANAKGIYLVIPKRWGNNPLIADALRKRKAKVRVVGDFDFLQSEDRRARAKVSLIHIDLCYVKDRFYRGRNNRQNVDPFELWFNENFKIEAKKDEFDYLYEKEKQKERKERIEQEIVKGNTVEVLVLLYNEELAKLLANYQKLSELDAALLEELNVNVKGAMESLKERIKNLKLLYWKELFSNLSTITDRLTSVTRKRLLEQLNENITIDFCESNIYSLILWVIKNANHYFEEQLLELYDRFTTEESVKLYKSNSRFARDKWKYTKIKDRLKEEKVRYYLDYRIVLHGYRDSWFEKDGLTKEHHRHIQDLITVAKNLGFAIEGYEQETAIGEQGCAYLQTSHPLKRGTVTNLGKIEEVYEIGQGEYQYKIKGEYFHQDLVLLPLFTYRPYKNGNIHFKCNQEFMKKFNVAVGKLRQWLRTPQEIVEELGIFSKEADALWENTKVYKVLPISLAHLLPLRRDGDVEIKKQEESGIGRQLTIFDFV